MLSVLLSCPLPCGVPLNMLLEILHYIYAPPAPPEEAPSAMQSSGQCAAIGISNPAGPTSPSSPRTDTFSSPPLLKRNGGSPFPPADPVVLDSSLQDVSRVLPFDTEGTFSAAADASPQQHRSIQFLVIAACLKPILAVTFVAAAPSLSLVGAHVRRFEYDSTSSHDTLPAGDQRLSAISDAASP